MDAEPAMSVAEGRRAWRPDNTVLYGKHRFSPDLWTNDRGITYTTHGPRAMATFGDQVSSTPAPALIALACAHIVPIQPVVFGSEWGLLLVAMQSPRDQRPVVLQQIPADLTTCPREVIEGIEVKPSNHRDDDAIL